MVFSKMDGYDTDEAFSQYLNIAEHNYFDEPEDILNDIALSQAYDLIMPIDNVNEFGEGKMISF